MKKIFLSMLLCVFLLPIAACGSSNSTANSENTESATVDTGLCMAVIEDTLSQYVSNLELSYHSDDWVCIDNEDGTITVATHVSCDGYPDNSSVNCTFTLAEDNKYKVNFLEFASEVLIDDGTIQ